MKKPLRDVDVSTFCRPISSLPFIFVDEWSISVFWPKSSVIRWNEDRIKIICHLYYKVIRNLEWQTWQQFYDHYVSLYDLRRRQMLNVSLYVYFELHDALVCCLFSPDGDTIIPLHFELPVTLLLEHIPLAATDYLVARCRREYTTDVDSFCGVIRLAFIFLRLVW